MIRSVVSFFKEPHALLEKEGKKIVISESTYNKLKKMMDDKELQEGEDSYTDLNEYVEEILGTWVDFNKDYS